MILIEKHFTILFWISFSHCIMINPINAQICHKLSTILRPGEVLCSGFKDLLRFNGDIYENTIEINLSKNSLTNINETSFIGKLNTVLRIFLDNNSLTTINPNAFKNLPNLEELDLSENKITYIDHNAFKSNNNLRIIDLTANKLETLDVNTVRHLNKLDELILTDNPLNVCDNDTATTLNYLKKRHVRLSLSLDQCNSTENKNIEDIVLKFIEIPITEEIPDDYIIKSSVDVSENVSYIKIGVIVLLLLTGITSTTILILCLKVPKKGKNEERDKKKRTTSGDYLINSQRYSSVSDGEDKYGYMIPRIPEVFPQYLVVIEEDRLIKLNKYIPNLAINEDDFYHVYEEISVPNKNRNSSNSH